MDIFSLDLCTVKLQVAVRCHLQILLKQLSLNFFCVLKEMVLERATRARGESCQDTVIVCSLLLLRAWVLYEGWTLLDYSSLPVIRYVTDCDSDVS